MRIEQIDFLMMISWDKIRVYHNWHFHWESTFYKIKGFLFLYSNFLYYQFFIFFVQPFCSTCCCYILLYSVLFCSVVINFFMSFIWKIAFLLLFLLKIFSCKFHFSVLENFKLFFQKVFYIKSFTFIKKISTFFSFIIRKLSLGNFYITNFLFRILENFKFWPEKWCHRILLFYSRKFWSKKDIIFCCWNFSFFSKKVLLYTRKSFFF